MSLVAKGEVVDVAPTDAGNPYADIILPPPAVRDTIDKTAAFVAQHGLEFERRMMLEANAAERFGFLFAGHGFRGYYERKLDEFRTGRVEQVRPVVPEAVLKVRQKESGEESMMALTNAAHADVDPFDGIQISKEEEEKTLLGFDRFAFCPARPAVTAQEDDIIRLAARFAACNGHSFTAGLSQRERGNPLFEFLKSGHSCHGYFKALVEAYSKVLKMHQQEMPTAMRRLRVLAGQLPVTAFEQEEAEAGADNGTLQRQIAARLWVKEKCLRRQREAQKKQDAEIAAEEAAAKSVAWERFVLVETILFTDEDQHLPLAAPDWEKKTIPLSAEEPPAEPEMLAASPIGPSAPPAPPKVLPAPAVLPAPTIENQTSTMTTTTTITVDGEEQKIVLKPDYVRRPKRAAVGGVKYFKCPITGQVVAAESMSAHLKVLLLDKQWKKQRDELLARAVADSAYAPDNDIESNIADFVMRRPDLFGTIDEEIKEAASRPEATAQKRSRMS